MIKYIDTNKIEIPEGFFNDLNVPKFFRWLNDLPTADVEEVKHGRWIGKPISGYANCRCSVCGVVCNVHANAGTLTQRYCYACGAKMDVEE